MDINSRAYDKLISKTDLEVVNDKLLWNSILDNTEVRSLKKGEILIKKFDIDPHIYVIVDGAFDCYLNIGQKQSKLVWFFFDTIFHAAVALDSHLKNKKTKYSLIASEDSTVIKFEKGFFDHLRTDYKTFNDFYIKEISGVFYNYFEIKNNMLALSSSEFFLYLRENYPFLVNRISSKKLANFMGITPEWLSKLKRKKINAVLGD